MKGRQKNTQIKNYCTSLVLWVLLCFISSALVKANDLDYRYKKAFKVQRLSLKEGLSQSAVQTIIQDQDGYIWLGTEDGLNRFDSYEFKIYKNDIRNEHSLHENSVISLLEDPARGIWVGTVAGLSLFNPKTESFTNYSENYPRLKTNIRNLYRTQEGIIWVATDKGLFYIEKESGDIKLFVTNKGFKFGFPIVDIAQKDNLLYINSKRCLFKIDLLTLESTNLCNLEGLKQLRQKDLTVLIVQGETLWIGSKSGLFSLDLRSNQFKSYYHDSKIVGSISDNYIQDFVLDENSLLWVATTEGVNLYDKNNEKFKHYKHQPFSDNGLSANDVLSLFIDKEKLVWLGTYGGGVNILDPNQHQFEHLLTKSDVINLGNNTAIHGIVKDRYESLWIASYGGGLIHYDLLTGEINRPLNDQNIEYDNFVWTLMIDHHDRLWQASIDQLNIIDVKTKKMYRTQYIVDGDIKQTMRGVNRIFEDNLGHIWIVSEYGFFRCDSVTMIDNQLMVSITELTSSLPKTYTSYIRSISSIVQDHDGNFWLGGKGGLVYYNVESDQWSHFKHDKNNLKSLTDTTVQVIFVDVSGGIWVGTTNGLNRLVVNEDNKDQVYFERITRYNGLPNDAIYGILEDKNREIWLSTSLGVVKYSENRNEIESYRSSDGLSSDEFNLGAYYSDENGRLYFGSINGITVINPKTRAKKIDQKNIVFSKITVGERNIDTYQLNHSEKPQLFQRKDETAIDISVANISFSKINTQRYRYRIIGLDGKWNYLETRRSIVIASLPQGKYILEIQSRGSDQGWQGGIKRLYLNVETDFWNSRQGIYLISFIVVLLYLISFFLISRYHRKRLQLVENKSDLNELRLKEIKIDNELMLHELGEREKRLSSLHQKLDVAAKRLDAQRFKDVTTGFYRVNYLYKVVNEKIMSQVDGNEIDKREDYYSLAIIELNDYARILKQHGLLIVSEFMSKLSDLVKQKIDAGSQVFTVQNGELLVLSKEKDNLKFKNKLLGLREQILRSYFDVANGISETTKVALSILSLQDTQLNSTRNLPILIDLLLQTHLLNNDPISGKVIEIVGAEQSVDFLFDLKSENIDQYIQAGKVKYHILSP